MKITKTYFKVLLLSGVLFFASCAKDAPQAPKGDYENGILISGEGSGANSGTVSYVSNDLSKSKQKVFKKVNKADLGIYLQSIAFDNDRAYIVVDKQNTITVVNRYTFEKVGVITEGLKTPRYMAIMNGKGYVTNWGDPYKADDDFVSVIDLQTFKEEGKIPVGLGPERVVTQGGNLFVSHKGAYGANNIVSVINTSNNTLVKEIKVNDIPDEMFFDGAGNLIVLSEGKKIYDTNWAVIGHTKGAISFIDTANNTVKRKIEFTEGVHPSQLTLNNNNLYYNIGNKVFMMNVNAISLPTTPLLEVPATYFYGIGVKNENIFIADAGNFKSSGQLLVYN